MTNDFQSEAKAVALKAQAEDANKRKKLEEDLKKAEDRIKELEEELKKKDVMGTGNAPVQDKPQSES